MLLKIKKLTNLFGYDIKKYHSFFNTVIKPLEIKTVIDIGANTGVYASEIRKLLPDASIYSFEPLADCFEELKQKMYADKNFKAFNVALGTEVGEIQINRSNFHPSSSLLQMNELHKDLYPKSRGGRTEKIKIDTLDSLLLKEDLKSAILIKVDVQGFEEKVIIGGQEIFKKASLAIVETSFVELYKNQPLFEDIFEKMRELGFVYYGDAGRHYSSQTDQLIYEDSIFIRKEVLKELKI